MTVTALPFRSDLKVFQEATFIRSITWRNKETQAPAVDLDDFNGKMTLRPISPSRGASITLTTENGGLVFDASTGTISIIIEPSQMDSWVQSSNAVKWGEYDLLLSPKVGTTPIYCLTYGMVSVTKGVTVL